MASKSKEIWKQITALKGKTTKNYGISNFGNMCSYQKSLQDKRLIAFANNNGFPVTTIRIDKRSTALFPHRQVANYFLKRPNAKYTFVLHLDHDKSNNHVSNLKWATQAQQSEHNKHNPVVKDAISRRIRTGAMAKKLSDPKVLKLKTELWNPKRKITLKQLAAKYDIAEMNLYRIKSGTFWYHIHVEGEPVWENYKGFIKNTKLAEKQAKKDKAAFDKKAKQKDKKTAKIKITNKKDKKKEVKPSKKNKADDKLKKKKRK
jgi:hypothetical protein